LGKTPLDPNRSSKVWFQDDVPGDVYQQGMDRFVVWDDAAWLTVFWARLL
jgi:phage terminase large subunit-like protein